MVHPSQPFVLTASDDMTIKLWDWDKGWKNVQVFEGHSHYVMVCAIPWEILSAVDGFVDRLLVGVLRTC